jgi:hypothetical protein
LSNKITILQEDCDPGAVDNKSLPCTAFFVSYMKEDRKCYDLVISGKQVDIFDHYWDKYKKEFITIKQSSGTSNPKLYNIPKGKVNE